MLAPVRTVAPTAHVVSLEEAKLFLRVDGNDEDDLITTLRDMAVEQLDGWAGILGRCLVTQTWRQDLGGFPVEDRIRLPLRPVASVSSVTYYDASNASQTLATSVYAGPFTDELGAYIVLKFGQSWPVTYAREDAVSVTFVAGAAAASIPARAKLLALQMIADAYDSRETVAFGVSVEKIPLSTRAENLLASLRLAWA